MRCLLFLFSLFTVVILHAQEDWTLSDLDRRVKQANFSEIEATIEGSRYYSDEFEEGSVLLSDSSFYSPVQLRYDAYADEIETLQHEQLVIIPSKEGMLYSVIGQDTIVAAQYVSGGHQHWGNFFLLERGNLSLYVKHSKAYKKAELPIAFQDAKPAEYVKVSDEYYWGIKGEVLEKVSNKKKTGIFLDNDKVMSFLKKEKLSLKKAEDLIRLVNYSNSIN